jgi:hypothetical protein
MPHNGAMPHSHYHPDTRAPTVGPPLFTRVTRHPQTPYKGYLVSTFAYDNLIDDAAQHGWLLHESLTTAGLVHYIAAVFNFPHPAQEWVDTRPQYLIDESLRRLGLPTPADPSSTPVPGPPSASAPRPQAFGLWWDPDMISTGDRRIRNFSARAFPTDLMAQTATRLGIVCDPAHRVARLTPHSLCSTFLEAWGQRNITPTYQPTRPKPLRYRNRKPKGDILW